MPKMEWKHTGDGSEASLTVKASPAPAKVTLWQVAAPRQDFRKSEWKPTELKLAEGSAEAKVAKPSSGALAFYALCEFNDDIEPYCLATQVRVLEAGK
jgi:PhoPQ-activated pathogenicity-related protein